MIVTESADGEVVRVEPAINRKRSQSSLRALFSRSSHSPTQEPSPSSSTPGLPTQQPAPESGESISCVKAKTSAEPQDDDGWVEDDSYQRDSHSTLSEDFPHALSSPRRRLPSSRLSRKSRRSSSQVRSPSTGRHKNREGHILRTSRAEAQPQRSRRRSVAFQDPPAGSGGDSTRLEVPEQSSRSSSPSRSIRFADHPVKPSRGGGSKRRTSQRARSGLSTLSTSHEPLDHPASQQAPTARDEQS